jgi:hypothetical protein
MIRKASHILASLYFAVSGVAALSRGFAFIVKGVTAPWPGDRDHIYQGLLALIFGAAYLGVALGLYRLDHRARIFAIVLASLGLVVTVWVSFSGTAVVILSWFALSLFVLIWLLAPSVRAQFAGAKEQAKAA